MGRPGASAIAHGVPGTGERSLEGVILWNAGREAAPYLLLSGSSAYGLAPGPYAL